MKRFFLSLILSVVPASLMSAQNGAILQKPRVDKNVELLSIVFRLAERPEYSDEHIKIYTDRINDWFGEYKDHKLIRFSKSTLWKYGISYDAVMSMAIHLDDNLNLKMGAESTLDRRWKRKHAEKFVGLLKEFAAETDFDGFYTSNSDLYDGGIRRFLPIYENLDIDWYGSFFGAEPSETFSIVIAFGNSGSYGPHNYDTNNRKHVYAILSTWQTDSLGMPVFSMEDFFMALIHEFNHSFVNHLNNKYKTEFKDSGKRLFAVVGDDMRTQAYGSSQTVINEALVRAAEIKYMQDHNVDAELIQARIESEKRMGFLWMEALVDELNRYDSRRDIYPTLADYIPRLIEEYNGYADYVEELEAKKPKIVSISEFENGATGVSPDTKTITINFDRPLRGDTYFFYLGPQGKESFPRYSSVVYSNDNRSVIMNVTMNKGVEYEFYLRGDHFLAEDGTQMKDYRIYFTTSE